MKNISAFLILIFLCSCVATKKIKDTEDLGRDEGVLVVGLDTDWNGHNNPLLATLEILYLGANDSALSHRKLQFKGNNHILVTALPSQEYYFYRISFGNRYADLKEGARFEIKPGKITYIGEISMNLDLKLFSASGDIEVTDKWDETLSYLKEEYPLILKGKDIERISIALEMEN